MLVGLVLGRDDLMKLELKVSDVLLGPEVFRLVCVIHIEGFDKEGLSLFEEIVDGEVGNELRIQAVINAFSPTNS